MPRRSWLRLMLVMCLWGHAWVATAAETAPLPERGICAHRGASRTHPENTLAAIREAVRLGAHQIEIDLQTTRDRQLVLMHDATLTRTTNARAVFPDRGSYPVASFTLDELKQLDAGAWKHPRYAGERVLTLEEAVAAIPPGIWLNLDIKEDGDSGALVAREVVRLGIHTRAILSVRGDAVNEARRVMRETGLKLLLNNMNRKSTTGEYVRDTIAGQYDFIQFYKKLPGEEELRALQAAKVRINYCCANSPEEIRALLQGGMHFPLVDDVSAGVAVCEELGLTPPVRQRSSDAVQAVPVGGRD